jgi:hypothetical protein
MQERVDERRTKHIRYMVDWEMNDNKVFFWWLQAMPQLTDRSKLPNIVDNVIKNTMDPKHLFQVWEYRCLNTDFMYKLT